MRAELLATPLGHNLSTRIRNPSIGAGGSYARFRSMVIRLAGGESLLAECLGSILLTRNFRFNKICKLCERLLPTEVAHLDGDNFRHPFLYDINLRSAGNFR